MTKFRRIEGCRTRHPEPAILSRYYEQLGKKPQPIPSTREAMLNCVSIDWELYESGFETIDTKARIWNDIAGALSDDRLNPGDIIELGCGAGAQTRLVLDALKLARIHYRHLYAFDTFSGYCSADIDAEGLYYAQQGLSGPVPGLLQNKAEGRWDISLDCIQEAFSTDEDDVTFIRGDVAKTCKQFEPASGKIRLVVIDTNVYSPAIAALNMLEKYFSQGCLIFCDSGFPTNGYLEGEHRALLEYSQKSGHQLFKTHYGNYLSFMVKVRN